MGLRADLPAPPVSLRLPPVGQIGIIVRDIRTAVECYSQVFGIESWTVKETSAPPLISTFMGQPATFRATIALGQTSSVVIELIQYHEGDTIHRDFAATHGEGIEHLGVYVPDLNEAMAEVGKAGISALEVVDGIGYSRDGRYAYLDTVGSMGITLELLQAPTQRNAPEAD